MNRASRSSTTRRFLPLAVVLAALALAAPSLADADWRQLPSPLPSMFSLTVASSESWMAQGSGGASPFEVTADGGAHWTGVSVPGYSSFFVAGAAADGSFRVVGVNNLSQESQVSQVFKIEPTGTIEAIGPVIHGYGQIFGDVATSPSGECWVPHREAGGSGDVLTIVAADGSSTDVPLPPGAAANGYRARSTALGMRLLRFIPYGAGSETYGGQTYRVEAGAALPAEAYPVSIAVGGWELSDEFGRGSWDGGATWGEEESVGVVPRTPGLGMPRYLTVRGGVIAEPYSGSLYRETGTAWPAGAPTNYVADAGPLIAWSSSAIFVDEGGLAPLPTTIGELQPDAQRLLARADLFRADAGLPPLTGDAQVSAASRNHSVYTALNPSQANDDLHDEESGLPGFTGGDPESRCAAVGTYCNSEVMYSPGFPDPVGGWLASIYHRPLVGSPEAGIVGAGEVTGGWSVMDARGPVNVEVGPFGYPVGRWRGESGFSGEIPDPVAACTAEGQPIAYPIGIAVSLYLPNRHGSVVAIHVHKQGEVADQSGCLLSDDTEDGKVMGAFILDEPLVPGQTYEATAVWNPGPDELLGVASRASANLTYSWSFNFDPDGAAGSTELHETKGCARPTLGRVASTAPSRHARHTVPGIELLLGPSGKATARIEAAQLQYRLGRHRRSVKLQLGSLAHHTLDLGPASVLRIRLPRALAAKLVKASSVRVRLTLAGRGAGCATVSKISKLHSVRPGWVRMKGQAEWATRSARAKRLHR